MPETQPATRIAHIVFFTLREPTLEAIEALLASCRENMADHPGTVHFSVGARADEFDRPVNDDRFHVGLHVVFESREAHDRYQVSPRHVAFVEANRESWAEIRVFDSRV